MSKAILSVLFICLAACVHLEQTKVSRHLLTTEAHAKITYGKEYVAKALNDYVPPSLNLCQQYGVANQVTVQNLYGAPITMAGTYLKQGKLAIPGKSTYYRWDKSTWVFSPEQKRSSGAMEWFMPSINYPKPSDHFYIVFSNNQGYVPIKYPPMSIPDCLAAFCYHVGTKSYWDIAATFNEVINKKTKMECRYIDNRLDRFTKQTKKVTLEINGWALGMRVDYNFSHNCSVQNIYLVIDRN